MNSVTLVGRLTTDAEVKTLPNVQIGKFTVACDDGFGKTKKTSFFDVAIFGKGTAVCQYLKKGKEVVIFGRLQQEKWNAQDGSTRMKIGIVATNVQMVGGAGGAGESRPDTNAYRPPTEDSTPNDNTRGPWAGGSIWD